MSINLGKKSLVKLCNLIQDNINEDQEIELNNVIFNTDFVPQFDMNFDRDAMEDYVVEYLNRFE